jgi:Arb2 domain
VVEYRSLNDDLGRKHGERLALYLWENYIEPFDFDGGRFFIGAGDAFHGLAKLLSDNGKAFHTQSPPLLPNH